MSTSDALGSLLQGVSQQPPAVRADGTSSEQVNFTSDVVQGLTSRPAAVETGVFTNTEDTDFEFLHIEFAGVPYVLGYKDYRIRIWDMQGAAQFFIVQNNDGDNPLSYIGRNMRAYTLGNTLFLANRDVAVGTSPAPTSSDVVTRRGIVYSLGGLFSRTYSLTVEYGDGTSATVEYTTPDGTTDGDAAQTSSEAIVSELAAVASASGFKSSSSVTVDGNTLGLSDSTHDFTVKVTDGEGGETIRAFTGRVDDAEDLSETAFHGMLVRVTGSDEGTADDFYLRFNSDVTDTLGGGFGSEGVWEEWFNVAEPSSLDPTTLPHVLELNDEGEFVLRQGEWKGRRVGDEDTNPFPDIVGHKIRDIGGFQSRLVMVGGPAVCMSRSKEPFDFFRETVLTDLATDPINLTSTEAGGVRFDWIIPFDRDLVIMSDPGTGQYVITGFNKLTPSNASMVKTTAFEMKGGAKPVETGRTILFPFKSGKFSGIKEFFTNDDVAKNGADTVTETVDRYIVGLVDHMQCSTNFSMVALKTDGFQQQNTVWVYKYLWQASEKIQSSWSKWVFPHAVRYFWFTGSELRVVMQADGINSGRADIIFAYVDMDIPADDEAGYPVCLDRQTTVTADAAHTVSLPYNGATFVQGAGCFNPGREVTPVSSTARSAFTGLATYTFDPVTVPETAEVIAGVRYSRWVVPTMPLARGRDGRPRPRTNLVVDRFMIEYENTGYIKTTMQSKYRKDPIELVVDWFSVDGDVEDPTKTGLRSGILDVPWGERSDWSELTIQSDDVRPTTILDIDWTGQVFKGGG